MKHLSERAAKGERSALQAVADLTLPRVYPLVYTMLDTDADVTAVCDATYRSLWTALAADSTLSEEQIVTLAVTTAAEQCRRLIQKKDSKAFRMPADRRFELKSVPVFSPAADQPLAVEAVHALPPIHRLVVAGQLAGGLSAADVAAVLKLDARTMALAVEAQPFNVEAILAQTDGKLSTYDALVAAWDALTVPPSAAVLDAVAASIHAVAGPKEKERRRKTWTTFGIIMGVCLIIGGLCAFVIWDMTRPDAVDSTSGDGTATTTTAPSDNNMGVTFSSDYTATHRAEITIADHGTITLELDANAAPRTVANFEHLANSGFYDGLTFHRIINGFMMQGGDPEGNGTGGSDANVIGEFTENGYINSLSHTRGAISMARADDYDSGSSQFFIVHEDNQPSLDGKYAAFGYVVDGMDIVDTICTTAVPTDSNGSIAAADQPIITTVTVTEL